MNPGDAIGVVSSNKTPGIGSVGCFVTSQDHGICFTIALHVATKARPNGVDGAEVQDGNSMRPVGTIASSSNNLLDTSIVRFTGDLPNSSNMISDFGIRLRAVWDPTTIIKRLNDAATMDEELKIKNEFLQVAHIGKGLRQKGTVSRTYTGKITYGTIDEETKKLRMTGRMSYPGDSGGPVFTSDGLLVGFISSGGESAASDNITVVLAHYVFSDRKCKLYSA